MSCSKLQRSFCALFLLCLATAGFPQETARPKSHFRINAADLVIQGSVHELNGEFDKALNNFNEALIYEPRSASISHAVARQYIWLGKVETAVRMLKRSVELDPDYIDSHRLLGQIYYREGHIKLAEQSYLEVLRVDSSNVDAYITLAQIYNSRKQYKQAAHFFQQLVDLGRANGEVRFQLGQLYFQLKQYDDAYHTFKQYVHDFPEIEQGYLAVGAVLVAKNDTLGAIEWYEQSYDHNHSFKAIREELASALVARNNWDAAIQLYEHAANADSTDLVSRLRLGGLYLAKGDTTTALQVFEDVTVSYPKEWRGFFQLGILQFSRRDWNQSIEALERSAALNKSWPETWFRLGLAYQQEGNVEKAEASYRTAQKLAPLHPGVNLNLGSVLLQQQRADEAIDFLTRAAQSAPDSSWLMTTSFLTLADAYTALGETEKSEEYYQKALALDPENPTILNNYSYSLAQRNERLEEARAMATKAIEKEPENGAFLDTVGWIYFKMSDYQRALEFIKKAVEIRDTSAEVLEHLGDVYDRLGQADLAMKSWQQARELEPTRQSVLVKLGIN